MSIGKRQSVGVLQLQPIIPGTGAGEWFTPPNLFQECVDKFGSFTLDAAADESNHKCPEYFTEKEDGRLQPWSGRVWCNPPYTKLIEWVRKADEETRLGRCEIAVLLLPAQTSTEWWHEYVWPRFLNGTVDLHWVRGKRRFGGQRKHTAFNGSVAICFKSVSPNTPNGGLFA